MDLVPGSMKEIPEIWTCRKKHGALTREGFYVFKHTPHADGSPSWRIKCKACGIDKSVARYLANPEASKAEVRAKRSADPETWRGYGRKSYQKHRPTRLASCKVKRIDVRRQVLEHYSDGGPTCAHCGDGIYEFLCLDHVNGDGGERRRALGKATEAYYRWVIRNGFPDGYRILCHNCNSALGVHGTAPPRDYGRFSVPSHKRDNRGRQMHRVTCLFRYGNGDPRCSCCRLANYEYLTIDHIEGGGRKHKRELGIHGHGFYVWLIRNGLPDGYRILCFNCNYAHGAFGSCPHVRAMEAGPMPA